MPAWPQPPPTRQISWRQLVLEADPGWLRASLQPVVYEFSNGRLFVDTIPTYPPFADGLINDGGVLILDSAAVGWPDSPVGLPAGAPYSNGGVVSWVPGAVYVPGKTVYYAQTGSVQMLGLNAAQFTTTKPPTGSGIIWNAYGDNEAWVA